MEKNVCYNHMYTFKQIFYLQLVMLVPLKMMEYKKVELIKDLIKIAIIKALLKFLHYLKIFLIFFFFHIEIVTNATA